MRMAAEEYLTNYLHFKEDELVGTNIMDMQLSKKGYDT